MKTSIITTVFALCCFMSMSATAQQKAVHKKGYAPVNGLKMYYEIHGAGAPIVLLHGAYMTIEGPMRKIAQELSGTRQVIVAEFQAHGRTGDIDRDITCENLADDVAALLKHLRIDSADVMGFSLGGAVVLQLAIRHPQAVKKMISMSASYSDEGIQPVFKPLVPTLTPALFEGTIFKQQYDSLAPNPAHFPRLVEKLKKLDMSPQNWEKDYVNIKHSLLLVFGDADGTTMEHATKMLTKLGGGVMGDLTPMPAVSLLVMPHTSHLRVLERTDWFMPMVMEFLNRK
ncbi:alpha/beta fold hydrolase [Chitinophaga lutea]|nr:alpha/beta hydrolase [Chitinophaga lutea]